MSWKKEDIIMSMRETEKWVWKRRGYINSIDDNMSMCWFAKGRKMFVTLYFHVLK